MFSVQCSVFSVQCSVFSVQCSVFTLAQVLSSLLLRVTPLKHQLLESVVSEAASLWVKHLPSDAEVYQLEPMMQGCKERWGLTWLVLGIYFQSFLSKFPKDTLQLLDFYEFNQNYFKLQLSYAFEKVSEKYLKYQIL